MSGEEHHGGLRQPESDVSSTVITSTEDTAPVETKDRGMFDFMGKNEGKGEDQGEVMATEFEKVHVSEPEPKEEKKKHGLKEKLHRSDSSSSSSSSDEEEGEGGKKKKEKKKGMKEKIKEKVEKKDGEEDTSVEVVHTETPLQPEEKKGFLEKIKEKLPGQNKKTEEVPAAPAPECAAVDQEGDQPKEKKGIFEKIKEKIPGYSPKSTEAEKEEKKEERASH